jgi:hypothetical protein
MEAMLFSETSQVQRDTWLRRQASFVNLFIWKVRAKPSLHLIKRGAMGEWRYRSTSS